MPAGCRVHEQLLEIPSPGAVQITAKCGICLYVGDASRRSQRQVCSDCRVRVSTATKTRTWDGRGCRLPPRSLSSSCFSYSPLSSTTWISEQAPSSLARRDWPGRAR